MTPTYLRTPAVNGLDTFVTRLADGCAATLRIGAGQDLLLFDLLAPAQSFSLSSVTCLRPLRDVLNAALDAHDKKHGIVTQPVTQPPMAVLPQVTIDCMVVERNILVADLAETKRLLENQHDTNKWQADKIGEHWDKIEGQREIIKKLQEKLQGDALREKAMTEERDALQVAKDRLSHRCESLRDSWLAVHSEWEKSKKNVEGLMEAASNHEGHLAAFRAAWKTLYEAREASDLEVLRVTRVLSGRTEDIAGWTETMKANSGNTTEHVRFLQTEIAALQNLLTQILL